MCGIIAIAGRRPVAKRLLGALRRLEYRGYDSAGIATLVEGDIVRRRAEGKLANLEVLESGEPLAGLTGIGHTRWATHGVPNETNAHPHVAGRVAVVHNGIIENFKALREELQARGHRLESETDTEVIAHLLDEALEGGLAAGDAVAEVLERLEGAFALAILVCGEEGRIHGARRGSPLVVGYGEGENFLGSDAIALAGLTNRIAYLEEGDRVEIEQGDVRIFDAGGRPANREISISSASAGLVDKGAYRHFMLKEIFEQPTVVGQTLGGYLDPLAERVTPGDLPFDLADISRLTLIACGTSYYAAMVARYWFEEIARLPVDVDIASEFRYRQPVLEPGGLALFISQSGETADTLAALRHCKAAGQHVGVVVNVPESSMAREADVVFPTRAGPEIGVASTKAFTCQLAVLAALAIAFAAARGRIDAAREAELVRELELLPALLNEALAENRRISEISVLLAKARDVLYLGRGVDYPLALEGALKLKEISYIHAEGYAAGEMKHGPIALIDETVPVIVIAPAGRLLDKTVSNMEEVIARGGRVILISTGAGLAAHGKRAEAGIRLPDSPAMLTPILCAIPVQLLAYHTAVHKGTDVDQPRNLAKSVTVE